MKVFCLCFLALVFAFSMSAAVRGEIIELFEDDKKFIEKLTNQDTATDIKNESKEIYRGEISLRLEAPEAVANGQRYNPMIPGWTYKITKNPAADDEARWIMFAWKKAGGQGIMIQFPNNGGWGGQKNGGRYFDGVNKTGWGGIQLVDEAPKDWEVQIQDLYEDFGEFTMTGVALTQYDNVGYYDSIYLAWTQDELKNMLKKWTSVEPGSKLTVQWGKIKLGN